MHVSRIAYGAQDPIPAVDDPIVITHGMCSRGGILMSAGDFFGDIILTSPVLRDMTLAKALSYCEVAQISRASLFEVLGAFP
jgi:hypothetical protein